MNRTERRLLAVNGDPDSIAEDLVDATTIAMRLGIKNPQLIHDWMHHLSHFPRSNGATPSYRMA